MRLSIHKCACLLRNQRRLRLSASPPVCDLRSRPNNTVLYQTTDRDHLFVVWVRLQACWFSLAPYAKGDATTGIADSAHAEYDDEHPPPGQREATRRRCAAVASLRMQTLAERGVLWVMQANRAVVRQLDVELRVGRSTVFRHVDLSPTDPLWAEHITAIYSLSRHSRRVRRHSRLRQERTEVSTLELTAPATLPTSTGPAAGLAVLTCRYVKAVGSRLGTVEQEPWPQPTEVCIWLGGA